MAKKNAKISPIMKEYSSNFQSLDSSLSKHGFVRAPGTGRIFLPHKEKTGLYRTGFEVDSPQMLRLQTTSLEAYQREVKERTEAKTRLEKALGVQLDGSSQYYNFSSNANQKVSPVKLGSADVFFDLNDPTQEVTWYWMKNHPMIAPSLEAYRRGEVPADTQYFVADQDVERKLIYNKKKEINKAIAKFEALDNKAKLRIARLMALPVTDSTPDEEVYNVMDSTLKDAEFSGGKFKGLSPIKLFNELVELKPEIIKTKDLVEQALIKNIYRVRDSGRVFEGEMQVAASVKDLVDRLLDDENQEEYLALEKKLIAKKQVEV